MAQGSRYLVSDPKELQKEHKQAVCLLLLALALSTIPGVAANIVRPTAMESIHLMLRQLALSEGLDSVAQCLLAALLCTATVCQADADIQDSHEPST